MVPYCSTTTLKSSAELGDQRSNPDLVPPASFLPAATVLDLQVA